jgi:hypothetical protein
VNKYDLVRDVRTLANGVPTVLGLLDGDIQKQQSDNFLYVDHSYLRRGWEKGNFRLIRGGPHLTRIIPHKEDRLESKFNVKLQPYHSNGSHIVVLVPGEHMLKFYKEPNIAKQMADECKKYTDRHIVFKKKMDGHDLFRVLKGAWAVICPYSVAGVEAAIAGYPVFSTPRCPTWPINAGALSDIEKPILHDRYEWANSLAWASWHQSELRSINYREYQCV